MSLLQEQCGQSERSPSPQNNLYEALHFPRDQLEPLPSLQDSASKGKVQNPTEPYKGPKPILILSDDTSQVKEPLKNGNGFPESPISMGPSHYPPPHILPPPLPSPRQNVPKRTKAFHWTVVPQDKV